MAIFQKSVIKKNIAALDKDQLDIAFQTFKDNFSIAKIEKIKELKEEEYQDGFLRDLLVDALGYTLKPDENFNLVREFKNLADGKKADGAILKNDKAIAVIELKSTKTKDLKSITQQAFNYKNNQPDCKYVITSNFQKLRFYIDYANEFEEFDLFNLSKEDFELLYLILSKDSIFKNIPLNLKKETIFHEENVSKQLYKDYSVFKNNLFDNLIKNNPDYDKLTLFKKSQKLIDRFLFILFAEDRGLLPPNLIDQIIQRFNRLKDDDAYKPLYDIYKQYFGYMNIGRKGKNYGDDIPAYNGGLFYLDEILDSLKIDDNILIDDLRKLSAYDFNTEVDVNILGHIFEHSLSEIEEITAELEGVTADKTKSKRKKDGIFYTPKYITQYIFENTVGKLYDEKRLELGIEEIEFDGSFKTKLGKLTAKGNDLYQTLKDYKNWLITLKILDPACGSGAFLNQALNFLILEHKTIDDIIAELTSTPLRLFDTNKEILENNLYGVDINEESVEIAKLSLWLRTATKGRKLSNLNDNIKCGNSLIDDPEVAGEKAFDWHKEFPQIFKVKTKKAEPKEIITKPDYLSLIEKQSKLVSEKAAQAAKLSNEAIKHSEKIYEYVQKQSYVNEPANDYNIPEGGFDVVIGNPPYVRQELIQKSDKTFLTNNYIVGNGVADLYVYFYEKAIKLLNKNGRLGYITPNKWFKTKYGKELRSFIKQFNITDVFDFFELKIFQDASTEPQIIIVKKEQNQNNFKYYPISKTSDFIAFSLSAIEIEKSKLKEDSWIFSTPKNDGILNKIYKNTISLKEYTNNGIKRGITTGLNKAFIIDEETKNKLISEDPKSSELIKKYVTATEIEKWRLTNVEKQYFINTYYDIDISKYPAIYKHLLKYNDELEKRQDKGKTHFNLRACKYYKEFEEHKILYIHTAVNHNFYYDKEGYYINNSSYFISNAGKFLACFLNSKIFNFYKRLNFVAYGDASKRGRVKLDYNKMINVPIPIIEENKKQPFIKKADKMLELNKQFQEKKKKFLNRIKDNFEIEKTTKKLNSFYDYDFKIFLSELKKQKIKLSLVQQDEWEEYFSSYKSELNQLQSEIKSTDKTIDEMVYELYDLTEEEIKIVEEG